MECWSEKALGNLPQPPIIIFEDGHIAVIESVNKDGTITCIESNN